MDNTQKAKNQDKTIATYDQFADVYDQEVIDFWDNFPSGAIQAFMQNLPGKDVINLGSGTGRDALLLKKAGCNVCCIDGSKKMVEHTQSLGFESHQSNFDELDIEQNRYAGVWAYTSLLHVPTNQMLDVLRTIYQALPPGGVCMLGMIEGKLEGMVRRESMPGVSRYFKFYQADELTQLVESIGFGLIYQDCYTPRSKTYLNQVYTKP